MTQHAEQFQVLVDNKTVFGGYDRQEAVQGYQEEVSRLGSKAANR